MHEYDNDLLSVAIPVFLILDPEHSWNIHLVRETVSDFLVQRGDG